MTCDDYPVVSIVVPVYNDPVGIERTLDALTDQNYPSNKTEILPVDNGSTDETPSIIRRYEDTYDVVTCVEEHSVQGSYAARNSGIEEASGNVFAFVDADMFMEPDWLKAAIEALDMAPYIGCDVKLVTGKKPTLAARFDDATAFPVERYVVEQQYAPTCCLVVQRSVVEAVGPFDQRLVSGGDSEFGHRVANAGYEQSFAPNATLYHPVRNTIGGLIKKELRVGRGLCQRQELYPDRYGRPGVPPRPSGIKSPDDEVTTHSPVDRLLFSLLSTVMTLVRAIGYYREVLRHITGLHQ